MLYKVEIKDLNIRIRPLEENDLRKGTSYRNWMIDKKVNKFNSHGLFPISNEELDGFISSLNKRKDSIVWAIENYDTKNSKWIHIGNIALQEINYIYRSGEIALLIGETSYWDKGIGTKVCDLVLKHGFNRLNLHRIWSGTAAINFSMIRVFEKLGFTYDGRFREGMFLEGRYVDILCYGILENEWRERCNCEQEEEGI